jgi:hypothetical protein
VTATVNSASERLPALAAPIACGCCLLAGAAYVTAVDPEAGGGFLPCPFRTLTGWWCPGCGLTRATHHLFRGDLGQALRFNLFVVLILAGLSLTWLVWALQAAGRPLRRAAPVPNWVYAGAITVLMAFAVVRNLPFVPGLRG